MSDFDNGTVRVVCQNEYTPRQAAVFIAGIYIGTFPLRDYDALKAAGVPLPDFPCNEQEG